MRIGVVAGEASGDLLGAGLVSALKDIYPGASFEGIAGPRMIEAGAQSLYPMERLSVMGIVEVLGRYTELRGIRNRLIKHLIDQSIDLFIGIDAPDFNLEIEHQLHEAGIKTVHYVSPSVWAWRQHRIKKIKRSTDLMLTLFPFEARFYEEHRIPVAFVGHPLADIIPLQSDKQAARHLLKLPADKKIIALLPGSRSNELQYLGESFLQVASWCHAQRDDLHFVTPLANPQRRRQFEECYQQHGQSLPLTLIDGMSREAMAAADVVLLASGTAALEAMLLKRPMVVAYRLAPVTYWIYKRLVKLSHYSLPNLLLPEPLIPEFIQHDIVTDAVGGKLLGYLDDDNKTHELVRQFEIIHLQLKRNASVAAATAVAGLLDKRGEDT